MDDTIRRALARDRMIDITTVGRGSGLPRRIETWFYRADDGIYLSGLPGRRDWYANLLAQPAFTFHLKEGATADLAARGSPVTDPKARWTILGAILRDLGRSADLDAWVAGSPLVAVTFDDQDDASPRTRGG